MCALGCTASLVTLPPSPGVKPGDKAERMEKILLLLAGVISRQAKSSSCPTALAPAGPAPYELPLAPRPCSAGHCWLEGKSAPMPHDGVRLHC